MSSNVTYKYIKQNPDIMEYIRRADRALEAQGYTEHSFAHVEIVAQNASLILTELGYDERQIELAKIAGIMHDIGNVINRIDHAPVSYTHLDVYKRQIMYIAAALISETICLI